MQAEIPIGVKGSGFLVESKSQEIYIEKSWFYYISLDFSVAHFCNGDVIGIASH